LTRERARWLRRALGDALALPQDERAEYLRTTAGSDTEFQRELRTLLADAQSDDPCFDSIFAAELPEEAVLRAGELLGPWRLRVELGHGGMEDVWLAERTDGSYEQRLAIKFPRARVATALSFARFERERALIAQLEHPGIARVVDGGWTTSGRPWFAMEYVEGAPVDVHVARLNLDARARIGLVSAAAAIVAAAHQRGIVHRDLKPSNVLVRADGRSAVWEAARGLLAPFVANATNDTELAREVLEYAVEVAAARAGSRFLAENATEREKLLERALLRGARMANVNGDAAAASACYRAAESLLPETDRRMGHESGVEEAFVAALVILEPDRALREREHRAGNVATLAQVGLANVALARGNARERSSGSAVRGLARRGCGVGRRSYPSGLATAPPGCARVRARERVRAVGARFSPRRSRADCVCRRRSQCLRARPCHRPPAGGRGAAFGTREGTAGALCGRRVADRWARDRASRVAPHRTVSPRPKFAAR